MKKPYEFCSRAELLAQLKRLRLKVDKYKRNDTNNLTAVINDSSDGILVVDEAGIVRLSNPAAESILRRQSGDLVGTQLGFPTNSTGRSEIEILTPARESVPIELWANETVWEGKPALRISLRDLSEKKRAESDLKKSEAKYRFLAETTLDCIWTMAPDLTMTYVNPAVKKLFGYTPEEYIGTHLSQHCDPEYFSRMLKIIERGPNAPPLENGGLFETCLNHKDGQGVHVEILAKALHDEHGNPVVFQGVTRDITARKKAFEQAQLLAAVVQSTQDAIVSKNLEGEITSWNSGAEAMYGYLASEAIGKSIFMLTPSIRHAEVRQILQEISEGRSVDTFETIRRTKSGGQIYISLTVSPIFNDLGQVVGASAIAKDITKLNQTMAALRRSEALLNETGEMAKIGGWELNLDSGEIFWTRKIKKILNLSDEHGLTLEDAIGQFTAEAGDQLSTALTLAEKEGRAYDLELPLLTSDNGKRWIRAAGRGDFQDNRCVRLHGIFQDITAQKMSEKKRIESEEKLRQVQKLESIGRFAGGIAHDFNNMLSVIIGYGEEILNDILPEDPLYESVEEILAAGQRSAALTRQLLAFSRRQPQQPEIIELNSVVKNLENMLRRLIGEDIILETSLTDGLYPVFVDPGQMEQVIMNLAVNARDAMPEGGQLTIETVNISITEAHETGVAPGNYVRLSVTDTGDGMDNETQERVFDPFFTTKEKGKGTGLGLSTVYGIVKQTQGNIRIHSQPGKGTTFKIYLPQSQRSLWEPKPESSRTLLEGTQKLVMVVEDEASLRKLCSRILKSLDFRVVEAANGREALLLVEEKKVQPDLIITDVIMPEMSGKVLVDRLKKRVLDLKVVFMSGYTDSVITDRIVSEAGIPFIQKPFSKSQLSHALKKVMES